MTWTPNDKKAIAWFFKENPDYRPALTYYPFITYVKEGKEEKIAIINLRSMWERRNKKLS